MPKNRCSPLKIRDSDIHIVELKKNNWESVKSIFEEGMATKNATFERRSKILNFE